MTNGPKKFSTCVGPPSSDGTKTTSRNRSSVRTTVTTACLKKKKITGARSGFPYFHQQQENGQQMGQVAAESEHVHLASGLGDVDGRPAFREREQNKKKKNATTHYVWVNVTTRVRIRLPINTIPSLYRYRRVRSCGFRPVEWPTLNRTDFRAEQKWNRTIIANRTNRGARRTPKLAVTLSTRAR